MARHLLHIHWRKEPLSIQEVSLQDPSGGGRGQEFKVVVNRDANKRVSVLQFQPGASGVEIAKEKEKLKLTLQRENNLKEFKSAHNISTQPTEGAGSEFGREAKEEARRRKFGYIRKKYNSDAQPWLLQADMPKQPTKKLKGTRNGGILENASYFIFTKKENNVFEAIPVDEWYNFKTTITYNNLNAEEAEEEFARRDKHLNMFSIMVRKRLKKEDDDFDEDSKSKVKDEIKSKGLMLTEMEDWADLSDEEGADELSDDGRAKKGKGVKGKGKGKKRRKDKDTDDEAVEDSDDGDMEAKQVDYMSDTSDSDSDMEERANKSKYGEKGVEDEEGLRDIVNSDNEDEKEDKDKTVENGNKKKEESDNESSSSESESDDPDQEANDFTKAFLMTGSKKERGRSPVPNRSATPTEDRKRKAESSNASNSPSSKRLKQEPTVPSLPSTSVRPSTPVAGGSGTSSASAASKDGLTEESVKRYLLRKPMSSKDLFKLFKSKKLGLSKQDLISNIANILKRLKTTTTKISGTVHFSISDK